MRVGWKLNICIAGSAFLLAIISGILGGVQFGILLFRAFLAAIIFWAAAIGLRIIIRRYLPEIEEFKDMIGKPRSTSAESASSANRNDDNDLLHEVFGSQSRYGAEGDRPIDVAHTESSPRQSMTLEDEISNNIDDRTPDDTVTDIEPTFDGSEQTLSSSSPIDSSTHDRVVESSSDVIRKLEQNDSEIMAQAVRTMITDKKEYL